ncbi:uncharacterized protein LOC110692045 [Chenopodium quinoa]|uniref:uncharacterized protein LOC110692045 n=1 Tax=Chenopodium quinoa TaxID=63459 RepID=UPI000B775394|nr:uncharacterized protein LOC110692045 [Chenopodium quinoa]
MEIFHTMKKRSKVRKGTIAMKLDMSKAYDREEWYFLENLLLKMGFADRWGVEIGRSSVTISLYYGGRCFFGSNKKASDYRLVHGAGASRKRPKISHLFFADNSLLLARAKRVECSKIVDILNIYEATSVVKINYEKSEVSFSKGVNVSKQEELVDLLQMRLVVKHEKYLRIPTVIGRSKRMVLAALKDRIWKKLQGYKGRLLSRAEKEVLIKSVIQAILTYLMGVYKLPNSVIEEIRGLTARFRWGNSDSRRRGAKSLVKEGLIWRVGDGSKIRIFDDPWVVDENWRFVCTPRIDKLIVVKDLVDAETKDWNYELLSGNFEERDVRCILSIPLSHRVQDDILTWAFSKECL